MALKKKLAKIFGKKVGYHEPDYALIAAIGVILLFGLLSLSSASAVFAYDRFGDVYYFLKRQLFGLGIGISAFVIFSRVDYRIWRKYAFGFLAISIFLLLLVFIPGLSAGYGSARSWINVFGYSLQPSELVKLSFLLYLAAWLESRQKKLSEIAQGIGPFITVLSIIGILMILQPDIGTLSIIAAISLIVYFVGGGKIKHIVLIIIFGAFGFALMVQSSDYQHERFKCLFDPGYDRQKACYQINQSLIAVGSGGISGRGLGGSRQKYMYLPEVSGDSIFAIIAEETGVIVSSLLIMIYAFLFYRGYLIAKKAPDQFGRILAIGIVSWIAIQTIVNIGGIINMIPMTGVPLPLISYGGSAMLASLTALGILVNISRQTRLR